MTAKRSARHFLQDILDSIGLVREYMEGLTREQFEENLFTQDAVARRIGIIAEHASTSLRKSRHSGRRYRGPRSCQ